jgi:hypothetical protein
MLAMNDKARMTWKTLGPKRKLLILGLGVLLAGLLQPLDDLRYWFTVRPPLIAGATQMRMEDSGVLHVETPPGAIVEKVIADNVAGLVLAAIGLVLVTTSAFCSKPEAAGATETEEALGPDEPVGSPQTEWHCWCGSRNSTDNPRCRLCGQPRP